MVRAKQNAYRWEVIMLRLINYSEINLLKKNLFLNIFKPGNE